MKQTDCVSFCRAMSDQTRQDILQLLQKRREMGVTAIVAAFGRHSQPTISHHLKILRHEGLVTSRRAGKEIIYSLNGDNVEECCGMLWTKFVPAKALAQYVKSRRRKHA